MATIDLTETSTSAISAALTQARRSMGGPAMGMVLTLIIVTNEAEQYDAVRAATHAGREHPSRTIAVITRRPQADSRLDAEIRVGESSPGETLLLRMYGPLGQHADSVAAPLLIPDVPVVTWWPDAAPPVPAKDPLGSVAQRRVTDAAAADAPRDMLLALARAYQPGDTDLSWTRATPWRSLLAAVLDQRHPELDSGQVLAEPANPTADLLAAWLELRLGIPVQRRESAGPGITEVRFDTSEGTIMVCRPDGRTATLSWAGRSDRKVALHRRETVELIAEELRRLEPDEVYAETLRALAAGAGAADQAAGAEAADQ
ncbi:MAG: glucose-6-phosphate dehydrogenase assembly protein OpcA [Streptosporangiaceae bacterium]|nr:glucose-6-phosphate dehydrogenase assembly protein OpcA [Streptosporangiaceae bacterium]